MGPQVRGAFYRPQCFLGAILRNVSVASVGLICSAGVGAEGAVGGQPGKIEGFRARDYVTDRKMIKVMTRSVQLGVAAIQQALDGFQDFNSIAAPRRAMFVGTTPLGGDAKDLLPALEASTNESGELSMEDFSSKGYDRIHPLWLIRGLSNNILGLSAAIHDFQGVNANYCSGESSGVLALMEAYWAVAEGRADIAVAGASDAMVEFSEKWMGKQGGEGAAFFVLRAGHPEDPWRINISPNAGAEKQLIQPDASLGYLGAAGDVVAIARSILQGDQAHVSLDSGRILAFQG